MVTLQEAPRPWCEAPESRWQATWQMYQASTERCCCSNASKSPPTQGDERATDHQIARDKMARNGLRRDCPRKIVDCSTIYAATDVKIY
jgi:hypothetical protein